MMKDNTHYLVYLLLTAMFFISFNSCVSENNSPVLPKDATVKLNKNGTPTYIKSSNIALDLEENQVYQKMKEGKHYQEMVYLLISNMPDVFKLSDPREQLELKKAETDKLNLKHLRFRPVYTKIPFWNREISVHFNEKDEIYLFLGNYEPEPFLVPTKPEITPVHAEKVAVHDASKKAGVWKPSDTGLIIWAENEGKLTLTYQITVESGFSKKYDYFIDATNGNILQKLSDIRY